MEEKVQMIRMTDKEILEYSIFEALKESRYSEYANVLNNHWTLANKCKFVVKNLSDYKWRRFVEVMNGHYGSQNSVNQRCQQLKAVLRSAPLEVQMAYPHNTYKILSVKKVPSQQTFLTEDECRLIAAYEPKTDSEYYVHRLFCLCLITGCRLSDAKRLTKANLRDNNQYLAYVSKKTHVDTIVRANQTIVDILADKKFARLQKKGISDSWYNSKLREIAKNVGITNEESVFRCGQYQTKERWMNIASHVARRSCASNIYKRDKSSLADISKLLGHTSIKTTESSYIKSDYSTSDAVIGFMDSIKLGDNQND